MKTKDEVISQFNQYVNMTASELETWLKSDDSRSAGWPKHDGKGEGETVGHDSGRKIVEILQSNPDKDPEKYTDEQIAHMRKVVSYCKRHLAQETSANNKKTDEQVKKTKSYASLKNWGHDFLRAQGRDRHSGEVTADEVESGSGGKESKEKETEKKEPKEHDDEDNKVRDEEERTAEKRKKEDDPAGENGASKKRQTHQGEGVPTENGPTEQDEGKKANGTPQRSDGDSKGDKEGGGGASSENGPSKGDTVSWKWGQGHPQGKVLDVKEEKTTITTTKGNQVSRKGKPEDPAVVLDTGGSKAIKLSHELDD